MHFLRGPQAFFFLVNAWIYSTLLYSFFSVLVAVVRIFFPNSPVFCCCCCCCRRFGCRVISMIQKNTDSDIIFFFSTFFFCPQNFFFSSSETFEPCPRGAVFFFSFLFCFFLTLDIRKLGEGIRRSNRILSAFTEFFFTEFHWHTVRKTGTRIKTQ